MANGDGGSPDVLLLRCAYRDSSSPVDLSGVPGVLAVREVRERGAGDVALIVSIASGILGSAKAAWEIVEKIRSKLRERPADGTTIRFPSGDEAPLAELNEARVTELVAEWIRSQNRRIP